MKLPHPLAVAARSFTTRRTIAALAGVMAPLLVAVACGSLGGRSRTGEVAAALTVAVDYTNHISLEPPAPLQNFHESSIAIVPPDAGAANDLCKNGVVHVSHNGGGRSIRTIWSCLSDPSAAGCYSDAGYSVADSAADIDAGIVDEWITLPSPASVNTHPNSGFHICDSSVVAAKYVGVDDTFSLRVGATSVVQFGAYTKRATTYPSCTPTNVQAVNVARWTTDCGATWGATEVNSNNLQSNTAGHPYMCSSFDGPYMYKDPWSSTIWASGLVGTNCAGGGSAMGLIYSTDGGQSWGGGTNGFVLPRTSTTDLIAPKLAMTSTADGMLVVVGCARSTDEMGANNRDLVAMYSCNPKFGTMTVLDSASNVCSMLGPGPQTNPPYGVANAQYMPSHRSGETYNSIAISRTDYNTALNTNYFRVGFTFVEPDSADAASSQRQSMEVWTLSVPKCGVSGTAAWGVPKTTIRAVNPDDSIFRGDFIEPSEFGPLDAGIPPDTAMLWWQEGRVSDGKYRTMYKMVQDRATWTSVAYLSTLNGSGYVSPLYLAGQCVGDSHDGGPVCPAGGYDHGAYFFDKTNSKMKYFTQWSESNTDAGANLFLYYNVASVNFP